jgi:1-acyl-sn-glycerol-3-phosphate acyltransferase
MHESSVPQRIRRRAGYEYLALALGWGFLGLECLIWSAFAALLIPVLSERAGRRVGRQAIVRGFRIYLRWLSFLGACSFDLDALDTLRDAPPLILAPNHPSLLDAVLIISRFPDLTCVIKAAIMRNPLFAAPVRLARYLSNDSLAGTIRQAGADLAQGSHLLLFPEGTRTSRAPLNPLKGSVGLIARRYGVPVQTLLIETDSGYLGKGWPVMRPPRMPVRYRVRLGRRFDPPEDVRAFNSELERYLRAELTGAAGREGPLGSGRPARPAIG